MNNKNKISVIMSVYNNESSVARAIESLLSQTFKNLEILIVDDASTDSTYQICKYFSSNNENIKLFQNDANIGLTKSLNFLADKATGDFLARQDGDDISSPNRLQSQITFMNNNKVDVSTTRAYDLNTKRILRKYSYYLPNKLLMYFKNPFIHGTLVIRKSVFMKISKYNEKFKFAQDFKLFKDLNDNNYKIIILKEPLYYLNTKNNISSNYKKEQKYYADCVINNIEPKN